MTMVLLENLSLTEQQNVTTTVEPSFQGDEAKYLIVPLVVIVVVMLLSLLVYCMAKRRKMNKLRREVAKLYEFDQKELEWEALNSYEHPYYNSGEFTSAFKRSDSYMPTTNL